MGALVRSCYIEVLMAVSRPPLVRMIESAAEAVLLFFCLHPAWTLPLLNQAQQQSGLHVGGLFVVSGVDSCGAGNGFCLLGKDCSLDEEFRADTAGGHCEGLRGAFTPNASFVCCSDNNVIFTRRIPISLPAHTSQMTDGATAANGLKSDLDEVLARVTAALSDAWRESTTPGNVEGKDKENAAPVEPGSSESEEASGWQEQVFDNEVSEPQETRRIPTLDAQGMPSTTAKAQNAVTMVKKPTSKPVTNNRLETPNRRPTPTKKKPASVKPAIVTKVPVGTMATVISQTPAAVPEDDKMTLTSSAAENTEATPTPATLEECPTYNGSCNATVAFLHDKTPMCNGILLEESWVLTSASCAIRIFRAGIVKVVVRSLNQPKLESSVRTIIVHENFQSSEKLEAFNIALVSLMHGMPELRMCLPCLPLLDQDFAQQHCTSLSRYKPVYQRRESDACAGMRGNGRHCDGIAQIERSGLMSLECYTPWNPRGGEEVGVGSPLLCRGYIAGVEADPSGVGMLLYSPVSQHVTWIKQNTDVLGPVQTFIMNRPQAERYVDSIR